MTKFKGDRRTKQGKTDYEQWKKNHSEASKGLGDELQKFTIYLKIYT